MSSPAVHLRPKVEQSGDVRVVTFTVSGVRDVENVIARELEGWTDGRDGCHLMLDFSNVVYVNSGELGTLVGLHARVTRAGGRLSLFNLTDRIYEIFALCRLQALLGISREGTVPPGARAAALKSEVALAGAVGAGDPDKYVCSEP
jgi:anti-anti-sigma factor